MTIPWWPQWVCLTLPTIRGIRVRGRNKLPLRYQPLKSHAHASPENRPCLSKPPCRINAKLESQIQPSLNPHDSENPENVSASALVFQPVLPVLRLVGLLFHFDA